MVKQLIYDSRMIVKKETIISACYDIQSSHKKHDGMIVVFQILNPAKRNAIAVKNEMRFSLQKRNVLQKSRLQSFRLSYPVEIQVSFKRLLKTI